MKAKKIYYSIVVGLQSLFILLLFVNIGYCIITSDLTMFPTTALYLNFYPFMNFFKTHNPYDLIVFISLLLITLATLLSFSISWMFKTWTNLSMDENICLGSYS